MNTIRELEEDYVEDNSYDVDILKEVLEEFGSMITVESLEYSLKSIPISRENILNTT